MKFDQDSRLVKPVARGIYRTCNPWTSEALLTGLRKLYNDSTPSWKAVEQEEAFAAIISWTEQVVAILPTGAGKSLLFMLPCTLPDSGITILVLPLVSLYADMLRRIQETKIGIWSDSRVKVEKPRQYSPVQKPSRRKNSPSTPGI